MPKSPARKRGCLFYLGAGIIAIVILFLIASQILEYVLRKELRNMLAETPSSLPELPIYPVDEANARAISKQFLTAWDHGDEVTLAFSREVLNALIKENITSASLSEQIRIDIQDNQIIVHASVLMDDLPLSKDIMNALEAQDKYLNTTMKLDCTLGKTGPSLLVREMKVSGKEPSLWSFLLKLTQTRDLVQLMPAFQIKNAQQIQKQLKLAIADIDIRDNQLVIRLAPGAKAATQKAKE